MKRQLIVTNSSQLKKENVHWQIRTDAVVYLKEQNRTFIATLQIISILKNVIIIFCNEKKTHGTKKNRIINSSGTSIDPLHFNLFKNWSLLKNRAVHTQTWNKLECLFVDQFSCILCDLDHNISHLRTMDIKISKKIGSCVSSL